MVDPKVPEVSALFIREGPAEFSICTEECSSRSRGTAGYSTGAKNSFESCVVHEEA